MTPYEQWCSRQLDELDKKPMEDRFPILAALFWTIMPTLALLVFFNFDSVFGTVLRWAGLG